MKKLVWMILITAGFAFGQQAYAQGYQLAMGVRLSNSSPTLNNSITAKYFMNNATALEGLLSFGSRFGVGGLYELHQPVNYPNLQWYYGAGGYIGFESNRTYLGPTGVVGLDYKFETIPLNLSLDWKPELDILPRIAFIPDAFGLSARFTLR